MSINEPGKAGGRVLRVADDLREQLADIIGREMRDPRVGMVSVTDARVSRDFAVADIYVSSLDQGDAEARRELVAVLNGAAGFLRSAVARHSTMRTTPKLRFHYDELPERGAQISRLIDDALQADRDAHKPGDEDDR